MSGQLKMNRADQYRLFIPFYTAENDRYEYLTTRANIFLAVIAALATAAGFGTVETFEATRLHWAIIITGAFSGIFLLLSLGAIVLSLRILTYKDICDVEDLVLEIEEKGYEEADVYSILLANLADAIKHNRAVNDRRARYLEHAVVLLGLSLTSYIILIVTKVII